MLTLSTSGASEIGARLDRVLRALDDQERVGQIFLAGAEVIRDDAKARVDVRTGRLRDHIFAGIRRMSGGVKAVVGVRWQDVPYCWDVELGTTRMGARPFLRPAAVTSQAAALDRMAAAGKTFLDEAVL